MREDGDFEDAMVEVGVRGEEWGAGVGMLGVGVLDGEEAGGGGGEWGWDRGVGFRVVGMAFWVLMLVLV